MKRGPRLLLVGSVVACCVGCDQLSKAVAHQSLAGRGPISLFRDVENPGAFLSLGAELPEGVRVWLLGVVVAVLLAFLARQMIVAPGFCLVQLVGLAMIVGGGVGNLVDRAKIGAVRDFINVGLGPVRTGGFNVADLAITVGVVLLLCSWWPAKPAKRSPDA